MTNARVRRAMVDANINQSGLAEILGWSESKVSNVLDVELSAKAQTEIIAKIKNAERSSDEPQKENNA